MVTSLVAPVDELSRDKTDSSINVNRYATKKTVAQGMLDIALLTSNASQLKYILQAGEKQQFYVLLVWLVSASIILQITMGVSMLSLNLFNECRSRPIEYKRTAGLANTAILGGYFLIAVLNIIISGFQPGLGVPETADNHENLATYEKQIGAGMLFLVIGGLDINKGDDRKPANIINDLILLLVFLVTAINVIISAFGFGTDTIGSTLMPTTTITP